MFKLIQPTLKYEKSYRQVMEALQKAGSPDYEGTLPNVKDAIGVWQKAAHDPQGYTHLWLMNDEKYLGFFQYNHRLVQAFEENAVWHIQDREVEPELLSRGLLNLGLQRLSKTILARYTPF